MLYIKKEDLMYYLDIFIRSINTSANISLKLNDQSYYTNVPGDHLGKNSVIFWVMEKIKHVQDFVIEFEIFTGGKVAYAYSEFKNEYFSDIENGNLFLCELFKEV